MRGMILLALCSFCMGCAVGSSAQRPSVYLELIAVEHGMAKFPDPLRLELINGKPTTLREAVDSLVLIVPAQPASDSNIQAECAIKTLSPLSDTYMGCKYAVCDLLPQRSRIQDCSYFIRLEQWIQREWLGSLCLMGVADDGYALTRWFKERGVKECAAMSEVIVVAYMQELAGLRWAESELLRQSAVGE